MTYLQFVQTWALVLQLYVIYVLTRVGKSLDRLEDK